MQPSPECLGLSIVGMGQAGQARKVCIDAHPRAYLVATVSRRDPDGVTFDDVCKNAAVDAVVVCTENALHPMQVEQALRYGKHVLVEFPLAPDGRTCVSLFDLAQRQNRILQVEFIGLLTQYHDQVAALIAREQIVAVRMDFHGHWYRWVAAEAEAAHWGQLSVSRLMHLQRWFGPLELKDVAFSKQVDGYQLDVQLEANDGIKIVFCDQRGQNLKRSQHLELTLANGQRVSPERPREAGDLFARDLDIFVRQILHPAQVEPYVSREAIIQVTELAAEISRRAAAMR